MFRCVILTLSLAALVTTQRSSEAKSSSSGERDGRPQNAGSLMDLRFLRPVYGGYGYSEYNRYASPYQGGYFRAPNSGGYGYPSYYGNGYGYRPTLLGVIGSAILDGVIGFREASLMRPYGSPGGGSSGSYSGGGSGGGSGGSRGSDSIRVESINQSNDRNDRGDRDRDRGDRDRDRDRGRDRDRDGNCDKSRDRDRDRDRYSYRRT